LEKLEKALNFSKIIVYQDLEIKIIMMNEFEEKVPYLLQTQSINNRLFENLKK
jgi:hypothetical protein